MEKYENMCKRNMEINQAKEQLALEMIRQMLDNGDKITVKTLEERTGLSKTIFYKNEKIREEREAAEAKQKGDPNINIHAKILKEKLDAENKRLIAQNDDLKEKCTYFKRKCSILEAKIKQLQDENAALKRRNQ